MAADFSACFTNTTDQVVSVCCHGEITMWRPREKKIVTSQRLALQIGKDETLKRKLSSDAPVAEKIIERVVETNVFRASEAQLKVLDSMGQGQVTAVLKFLSGGTEPVAGAKLDVEDLRQKVRVLTRSAGKTINLPPPPSEG